MHTTRMYEPWGSRSEKIRVEWSLDSDASNTAVLVASEAHAVTLAIEGIRGIVFVVATLTDEAIDVGVLESPRLKVDPSTKCTGKTTILCTCIFGSMWLTILDDLSFILMNYTTNHAISPLRSQVFDEVGRVVGVTLEGEIANCMKGGSCIWSKLLIGKHLILKAFALVPVISTCCYSTLILPTCDVPHAAALLLSFPYVLYPAI